ncbi:MAG: energy transducer TonB [Pseudomonadota bacterium]
MSRYAMMALAAMLCFEARAQEDAIGAPETNSPGEAVTPVETTSKQKTLSDLKEDLTLCLAGSCDPEEDIDASLIYAEELFVAGEIRAAYAVVMNAVKRNEAVASEYPGPISSLHRASARLAEQLGDLDAARHGLTRMRDVLRDHDTDNLEDRVVTEIELADGIRKAGDWGAAENGYRNALQLALDGEQAKMAALTAMRLADTLMNAPVGLAGVGVDPYEARRERIAEARNILADLLTVQPQDDSYLVTKAKLMAIRIDRETGLLTSAAAEAALDGVIAEMAALPPSATPTLVHQPGIVTGVEPNFTHDVGRPGDRVGGVEDWVDVRFRIDSDGRPTDVEAVQSSGAADWPGRVMSGIRGRRYVPPVSADQFSPGNVRLERITRVYDIEPEARAGASMRVRSGRASVRSVDLTPSSNETSENR